MLLAKSFPAGKGKVTQELNWLRSTPPLSPTTTITPITKSEICVLNQSIFGNKQHLCHTEIDCQHMPMSLLPMTIYFGNKISSQHSSSSTSVLVGYPATFVFGNHDQRALHAPPPTCQRGGRRNFGTPILKGCQSMMEKKDNILQMWTLPISFIAVISWCLW